MADRFKTNAAAHVLVLKDNKVLMLRRYNTGWMDGLYTTPTGHIEKGESAAEAAARELFEEAGVTVDPVKLEHAITVHRQNEVKDVYFDNYFVAHEWIGTPHIGEPEKADELKWLELDTLDEKVVPTVLRALRNYLDGKHYAEDGWDQ